MTPDKTPIEVAIEQVLIALETAKSHALIDSLTEALADLAKARGWESDGHK